MQFFFLRFTHAGNSCSDFDTRHLGHTSFFSSRHSVHVRLAFCLRFAYAGNSCSDFDAWHLVHTSFFDVRHSVHVRLASCLRFAYAGNSCSDFDACHLTHEKIASCCTSDWDRLQRPLCIDLDIPKSGTVMSCRSSSGILLPATPAE